MVLVNRMKHLMQSFVTCIAGEYISRVKVCILVFNTQTAVFKFMGYGWWLIVGAISMGTSLFNIQKYLNGQAALS